eukprot:gene2492-3201_t
MSDKLISVEDYHKKAKEILPKTIYDYYRSGADDESTLFHNQNDFQVIKLRPRALVNVSKIDLSTTVLGQKVSTPILIAPTAMQKMCHHDGEIATAKATKKLNTLMTLSTMSTTSIEDVGNCLGSTPHWMQLYVCRDRNVTIDLIKKAEQTGYTALVMTVDTALLGNREADHKNGFSLPNGLELPNIPSVTESVMLKTSKKNYSQLNYFVETQIDQTLNWESVKWIKKQTKMKIILKGIITYEDAILAHEAQVDAIWVSNHGGRQLDTCVSTIQALPEVMQAMKDTNSKIEVFLDGGIRRGTDVIKALALGAKAVFVGRPVLWGLACNGENGVNDVIETLNSELYRGMALCGCTDIEGITEKLIYKKNCLFSPNSKL